MKASPKHLVSLLLVCVIGRAESSNPIPKARVDAHLVSMDSAQDLQYDIKDALDAKDPAKIAGPASELLKLCRQEEQFWQDAGLKEAQAIAKSNREAAEQLVTASKEKNPGSAQTADDQLQQTCRSCHDHHFEKQLEVR